MALPKLTGPLKKKKKKEGKLFWGMIFSKLALNLPQLSELKNLLILFFIILEWDNTISNRSPI